MVSCGVPTCLEPAVGSCLILTAKGFGTFHAVGYLASLGDASRGLTCTVKGSKPANSRTISGVVLVFIDHIGEMSSATVPTAL